jgi:hypothetical protein
LQNDENIILTNAVVPNLHILNTILTIPNMCV